MTIASKTDLLGFRFIRAGSVFADIATKSSIDTSDISSFVRNGNTFFGVSNETTPSWPNIVSYSRNGNVFNDVTAKSTINASEFDVVRNGSPFWVEYIAPPPPTGYIASQFFMVF